MLFLHMCKMADSWLTYNMSVNEYRDCNKLKNFSCFFEPMSRFFSTSVPLWLIARLTPMLLPAVWPLLFMSHVHITLCLKLALNHCIDPITVKHMHACMHTYGIDHNCSLFHHQRCTTG